MRVRLITSLREFDTLASVWRELTMASGQTSPFLSHDWFACCWRAAGPDRRRELWVVEDLAGPLAIFPLVYAKPRVHGLPVRIVHPLDSPYSPFIDFPVAGSTDLVVNTFIESLRSRRDWDLVTLPKLPAQSPMTKALEAALASNFSWRTADTTASQYLAISGTWENFAQRTTWRVGDTWGGLAIRLQRRGVLTVEEHKEMDPDGSIFAELTELSGASWKEAGTLPMTMYGVLRFFRELTQRANRNGWLRLWILRLNGRAVATEYQIGENGHLHALRNDADSTLGDVFPGTYLTLRIIQSLFDRRSVREYDLRPLTNGFKRPWATGLRDTVALDCYSPTAYGRLLREIETRLAPFTRSLRNQTRCG